MINGAPVLLIPASTKRTSIFAERWHGAELDDDVDQDVRGTDVVCHRTQVIADSKGSI